MDQATHFIFATMRSWFTLIFSLTVLTAFAQEYCGTVPTPEQLDYMKRIHQLDAESGARTAASLVRIPVVFHVIRTSAGEGGFSQAQAETVISRVNSYYAPVAMEFFLAREINYIDNDTYYNLNSANEGAVAVPNDVPGVINIYFSNTLTSGGSQLCGYTRFPPSSDRVFMANGCTFNGTTLEHELGHYFTLFHTHGKTNTGTTDELVNGSNCSSAGDDLCDTPADPNLSGKVSNGCVYTGTVVDANGQPYAPQVSNIMSYAPSSCRILFTSDQYNRIRNGFENGRSYLQVEYEEFTAGIFALNRSTCKGGSIDFQATGSGAISWEWEFLGGTPATSTSRTPKIKYVSSGSFSVKLTARAANGQSVVVERPAFITIDDPLEFALTGDRHYPFENGLSAELKVQNPDLGFTFTASSVDRNDDPLSGSIVVPNFNYFSEQPINYDYLQTSFFNNAGVRRYSLSFDVSYAPRLGGEVGDLIFSDRNDSLSVLFYGKCEVKPVEIWRQGGDELRTSEALENEFYPTINQWKRVELQIPLTNEEFGQFTWVSSSVNGNNVFIDNISIVPDYSLNAPTNFRVTRTNPGDVLLRWIDQSVNELNFVINRSVNNGPFLEYVVLPSNVLSYLDSDTQVGNSYAYELYAKGFSTNKSELVGPVLVDLIVGVEEEIVLKDMKLYPNPLANEFTIELPKANESYSFSFFDSFGRSIKLKEILRMDNKLIFDTSTLSSGLYFFRVNLGKEQTIRKLIK